MVTSACFTLHCGDSVKLPKLKCEGVGRGYVRDAAKLARYGFLLPGSSASLPQWDAPSQYAQNAAALFPRRQHTRRSQAAGHTARPLLAEQPLLNEILEAPKRALEVLQATETYDGLPVALDWCGGAIQKMLQISHNKGPTLRRR